MTEAKVLDHGFVKLISFMGGDLSVVNSARISYNKIHDQMEPGDDKLINFLVKHRHGTPLESSVFTFHVKAPIAITREWMRHRFASYNEVSGRYTQLPEEMYLPSGDAFRTQVGKPGHYSFERISGSEKIKAMEENIATTYWRCYRTYEELIEMGLAREVARNVLPVGIYTEFYFTVNCRSLMNFLSLRNADNALYEIRQYAIAIESMFKDLMPITYEAFVKNGRAVP